MSRSVIETFPLGMPWQTFDPFLFCVHHQDDYPAGTADLAPQVPLTGRNIGSDFSDLDGWSMYHGTHVPGFPQHPHRGFETISFVRSGYMDHADSLGASARFGAGDVQWMTAGAGIVHSEMFPLLESEAPNPVELFQIWINLPAEDKLVPPHFKMLWSADIPRVEERDKNGRTVEITVIAGEVNELSPPSPPPHSWASQPENDVAIWHVRLEADARWELPVAATGDTVRSVYVHDGGPVGFDAEPIAAGTGAVVRSDRAVIMEASEGGAECLVLQGRPIGEPVAQYGPFVMSDRDGIVQAFSDYRSTGFGGWPWSTDDPDHGPQRRRFALHSDGTEETAPD